MPSYTLTPAGTNVSTLGNNSDPTLTANSTAAVQTPTRTLYDPTAGDTLYGNLNNAFDTSSQSTGILDRYNQAQTATAANTKQTGQYLQDMYGQNVNFQTQQNTNEQTGSNEGRVGFATNVAALTNLQAQGAKRVKDLTDQANQALMANNAQGAQALSDLAVQEQTALTTARTNFLSNYFGTQQEARAQATFQTPEQASVMTLAQQYPGAGISPTDTLDAASQKISSSPLYQANLGEVQQNIATAKAQAGLATAQAGVVPQEAAAQTESARAAMASAAASQTSAAAAMTTAGPQAEYQKTLTNLLQGGSDPTYYANQLLLNQKNPSQGMTLSNVESALNALPGGAGGGILQEVLSTAGSQGYNSAGTGYADTAAATNANNVASGGYTGATTAATNWLTSFLGAGSGATNNSSSNNNLSTYLNPTAGATTTLGGQSYTFTNGNWIPSK